nr:DNA/RNA nuclease SfsA [Gracilinema caldarium]
MEAPTKKNDTESSTLNLRLFSADARAVFVRRPNRFLILARIVEVLQGTGTPEGTGMYEPGADGELGQEVACHCPNPGRLLEFVIPGTELLLERRRSSARAIRDAGAVSQSKAPAATGGPKTQWTAVAVRYRDKLVPLFSARANGVVEQGVLPVLFPAARHIQAEYTLGDSRFDFMVQDEAGLLHLIEVKACSLVEEGIAMFPDAPSERAVKHIEELAYLIKQGYRCHILFVIVHGHAERFIPNLHTDPEFASALSKAAGAIEVHAVTLEADEQGRGRIINMNVPVDLSFGSLAEANRGSYLILLEVPDAVQIYVGSLGPVCFQAGWYVYAGSAQKNLSQRIARHLRHVRKQAHWHLDYLTAHAGKMIGLPIASYDNLECELADGLKNIGGEPVPRFGSSDCSCESHLFYFSAPPLKNRDFLTLLFYFRHRRALGL